MSGENGEGVGAETGAQAPPNFIWPNFDRMPTELKLLKNLVLWGGVWNGSKRNKRQISDHGASQTNPRHWSSFDNVKQAYEGAVRRMSVQRWLATQENQGRSDTATAERSSARELRGAL
jgi:hypothetical protein